MAGLTKENTFNRINSFLVYVETKKKTNSKFFW